MTKVITPRPMSDYGMVRIPNVRVVGPRLLVMEKPRRETTTDTGIIVPEFAQENAQVGVVLVVGDGVTLADGTRLPPVVEMGDEIIYARYAGIELSMEDQKYLIIQESDVRVVLSYRGKILSVLDEEEVS